MDFVSVHTKWRHRNAQQLGSESLVDMPEAGIYRFCLFLAAELWPCPHYTAVWSWIWGGQFWDRSANRQPRSQVAAKPLRFLQPPAPWPQLHTDSRCGANTQRGKIMGCFWVEPWLPACAIHRFTVTIWASLALTVTSCGAGHPLVDEKLISWLMKKWKVLFKTYLRITTQTENLRKL